MLPSTLLGAQVLAWGELVPGTQTPWCFGKGQSGGLPHLATVQRCVQWVTQWGLVHSQSRSLVCPGTGVTVHSRVPHLLWAEGVGPGKVRGIPGSVSLPLARAWCVGPAGDGLWGWAACDGLRSPYK